MDLAKGPAAKGSLARSTTSIPNDKTLQTPIGGSVDSPSSELLRQVLHRVSKPTLLFTRCVNGIMDHSVDLFAVGCLK